MLLPAPPEPFVPPELQGKPVLGMAALYVGGAEQGAAVVQPLKAGRPPAKRVRLRQRRAMADLSAFAVHRHA